MEERAKEGERQNSKEGRLKEKVGIGEKRAGVDGEKKRREKGCRRQELRRNERKPSNRKEILQNCNRMPAKLHEPL